MSLLGRNNTFSHSFQALFVGPSVGSHCQVSLKRFLCVHVRALKLSHSDHQILSCLNALHPWIVFRRVLVLPNFFHPGIHCLLLIPGLVCVATWKVGHTRPASPQPALPWRSWGVAMPPGNCGPSSQFWVYPWVSSRLGALIKPSTEGTQEAYYLDAPFRCEWTGFLLWALGSDRNNKIKRQKCIFSVEWLGSAFE